MMMIDSGLLFWGHLVYWLSWYGYLFR